MVAGCGARVGTQSRGCSSRSRCPRGAPRAPAGGPSRLAGGSTGGGELLVPGLDVPKRRPLEPQVGREPSRGGRGQGTAPRPGAAPGGSSPTAWPTRRARWQRPARATWPSEGRRPGPPTTWQALPGLFQAPTRGGPSPVAASPLVFHSPPPSIVPTHGGPGPGRRRQLVQTWSCHCPSFRERTFL